MKKYDLLLNLAEAGAIPFSENSSKYIEVMNSFLKKWHSIWVPDVWGMIKQINIKMDLI